MKKKLLAIGVALCLIVAGSKIYKAFREHQAPYKVGDCFEIQELGSVFKFEVVSTDNVKAEMDLVAVAEDFGIAAPVRATYAEIRSYHTSKVSCE